MPTYEIRRLFFNEEIAPYTVKSGLTLEEAQAHCNDPETSSRTATDGEGDVGPWFDGYEEE